MIKIVKPDSLFYLSYNTNFCFSYFSASSAGTWRAGSNDGFTVLFSVGSQGVYSQSVTGRAVNASSGNALGTTSSTRRKKENIVPYVDEENKILSISPVTFDYKTGVLIPEQESERFNHFGMVAEDLHDAGLNHLVHYDAEGQCDGIDYAMLSVELLGVIKNLETRIKNLEG